MYPLRRVHRLMRRAAGPEPVTRRAERPVPLRLQHLQDRLLDETVEHRRDAERATAAGRLRYLDPPHRLRLVGAVEQLGADRRPLLLQMSPRSLTVMPSIPGAPLLRFTRANASLRLSL